MALTAQETDYLEFAKGALPGWVNDADEFLFGAAKMFGGVHAMIEYLFGPTGQALIQYATGATATTPDWLRQHARDRGTDRQAAEDDPTLRDRLRNVPDALTRPALLAATNAILAAAGVAGSAAMVELWRDAGFFGSYASDAGVGGTFAVGTGTQMKFTPTGAWARPPYRDASVVRKIQAFQLEISGAANAGNDGTFDVLGLDGNAAIIDNAAGVAGADAGATWTVLKLDRRGNVRDGFARAYADRGYRYGSRRPTIVLILPFGSTSGVEASVTEMLRQKKAGGFRAIVERRLNP